MSLGTSFLELFGPAPIYAAGQSLALVVYATLTPVLLIMAIAIRTLEAQADVLAGQGKWAVALRDFFLYGLAISAYFGIANLIVAFMNAIYSWIDTFGSIKAVASSMDTLMSQLNDRNANESLTNKIMTVTSVPSVLIALLFYYLSYLIVTCLSVFLRIAHAIGYSIAVVYGLIALPLSISSSLRLLKGWATVMAFMLLWPVVEGMAIGLFSPVFMHAAQVILDDPSRSVGIADFTVTMFYTLLNVLIACILIAAPFVAGALVNNASAHTGLVSPFVGGALAAASMMFKSNASSSNGNRTGRSSTPSTSPLSSLLPIAGNRQPQPRAGGIPSAAATSISGMTARNGAASSNGPTSGSSSAPVGGDRQAQTKQQRRGAIIQQQRKARPE